MAIFQWSERYLVHIDKIDQQHRGLIHAVNDLHDAMQTGKGSTAVRETLNTLIDYTVTHFTDEEDLMRENEFPGYEAHKRQHDAMKAKVLKCKEEVDDGGVLTSVEVMNFMIEWLTEHILKSDKQFGPYLWYKGVH
jgi:hemerythrin